MSGAVTTTVVTTAVTTLPLAATFAKDETVLFVPFSTIFLVPALTICLEAFLVVTLRICFVVVPMTTCSTADHPPLFTANFIASSLLMPSFFAMKKVTAAVIPTALAQLTLSVAASYVILKIFPDFATF